MRTVNDILESKPQPFNIIAPDRLVIEALQLMNSVNLSYLIVMDGDKYKGLFSERDYSRNVILKGRSSSSTTVQEVMTTDLPVVRLTDSVEHCINLINTHKTRYLLACNDADKVVGVITIHDLLRQVINNRGEFNNDALAHQLIDHDERGVY
jgi:predicted transcriptional regulator